MMVGEPPLSSYEIELLSEIKRYEKIIDSQRKQLRYAHQALRKVLNYDAEQFIEYLSYAEALSSERSR